METETLKITRSPFVSDEIIDELAEVFSSITVEKSVEPIERTRSFQEHFDVKELVDIVVRFVDPHNEFWRSVFITLGADLVKNALKKAYSTFVKTKNKRGEESIEISLSYSDVRATFKLKGTYKDEDIEKCFNSFGNLIASDQLLSDSSNPRFHKDVVRFDGVKYHYDIDKNLWIPHDYEKDRQDMYKRMRDLGH